MFNNKTSNSDTKNTHQPIAKQPSAPNTTTDNVASPSQTTRNDNWTKSMLKYEAKEDTSDSDYADKVQKTDFRLLLMNWKKQLMEEVDRTVVHMKDKANNLPDPADRASQEEEFNLELRARDRERKLIKKIDNALIRLDNDEYGYCVACGIEIGYQRLIARPTAALCIDCKTIDEIRERQLSKSI